jgi:aminopeptidase N
MAERVREVLPAYAHPTHYSLDLAPDLVACTFTGTVVIDVKIVVATHQLQLNAHELTFKSASIDGLMASSIDMDNEAQIVTLSFDNQLSIGNVKLYEHILFSGIYFEPRTIHYAGILNDQMAGFYASKYEKEGVTKTMAVTQFEACDARRAFPCWDEPNLKAI